MEGLEKVLEHLKENSSLKSKDVLKDIVVIDGAIAQDKNSDYVQKTNKRLEEKYYVELRNLKYNELKQETQEKMDECDTSFKKYLNTDLGILKLFLIRIAAIENIESKEINMILKDIYSEENLESLKELYNKLDNLLLTKI